MSVLVFTASGGGGHKASARAVVDACAGTGLRFHVVDYSAPLGLGATWGDAFYNWLLASERVTWVPWLHRLTGWGTRLARAWMVRRYRLFVSVIKPSLVISCCPHLNQVFVEACAPVPVLTLVTDFESSDDHPWLQDLRQYVVCGTDRLLQQARALGYAEDHVFPTQGMLVHPSFYEPRPPVAPVDLLSGRRTVCVCFGGVLPRYVQALVERLGALPEPLNVVVLGAKERTVQAVGAAWVVYVPFTPHVAAYFKWSDAVLGKPGPGVVTEAVAAGVPVVVERHPLHTPPQEYVVAAWIEQTGVGQVLSSWDQVGAALAPVALDACRDRMAHVPLTAYLEFPAIVEKIISRGF
jgi:UDP-N-acetylglucosamine:LPS N-acetylglucosamine transferase